MNFNYDPTLESKNFVDGVDFTNQDPCIWNVYPPGASGDLLSSIINCHYGRTGSSYFGIDSLGQVIFRPSDYKITNTRHDTNQSLFDDQHFFDIADSLGSRNINYSMCDQFIFSCHLHRDRDLSKILDTFPQCKIIRTYLADSHGKEIVRFMSQLKNSNNLIEPCLGSNQKFNDELASTSRLLNIPFGVLFDKKSYYRWYDRIIKFLNLNGRLICFDYVEYYISKQHPMIRDILIEYSRQS